MKTILITGSSGFIGNYLASTLKSKYKVIGIDSAKVSLSACDIEYTMDITDYEKVEEVFKRHHIDFVIHLAAEKSLVSCENNRKKAYETNFIASEFLYELTKAQNGKFIFISSDQVFDGLEGNYVETSKTSPINYYGVLKEKFENRIKLDSHAAICRTALVFGAIPQHQMNYFRQVRSKDVLVVQGYIVQHVIHKLLHKESIHLPVDEFITPTSVELLSEQIQSIIDNDVSGILHCCGGERISRYEFGKKIAKVFDLEDQYISSRSSHDKLRPKDVSLAYDDSRQALGVDYPNMNTMLNQLKQNMLIETV